MRGRGWLIAVVLVSCKKSPADRVETARATTTSESVRDAPAPSSTSATPAFDLTAFVRGHYGERCLRDLAVCGDIAYLPCDSAVDGPAYHLRAHHGPAISSCRGRCSPTHGE